mmetsp:Transcript_60346/g.167060  ORF Transcript_60346/g.167060 Transcript_60346/m.167060 type:complete len:335 (-) Transcript_60346:3-1007(-)
MRWQIVTTTVRSGEAFVVHSDVHALHDKRVKRKCQPHCHCVKEKSGASRWVVRTVGHLRHVVPQCIIPHAILAQQLPHQRRIAGEQGVVVWVLGLDFASLVLGLARGLRMHGPQRHRPTRVQRRDDLACKWGVKRGLACRHIAEHIVLWDHLLAVPSVHRAVHAHEHEPRRNGWLAAQRLSNIVQRGDGQKRHRPLCCGFGHDEVNERPHSVLVHGLRRRHLEAGYSSGLGKWLVRAAVATEADGNAAGGVHRKNPGHELCAVSVMAWPSCQHVAQPQLRGPHEQGQRPRIVYVVTDVSVQDNIDHMLFHGGGRHGTPFWSQSNVPAHTGEVQP